MKAKGYIYEKLHTMANQFPSITFTYEYKEKYKTHIVEVIPEYEFDTNDEYIDCEIDISSEFNEKFFPESILFISENSLTQISNPEKVFKSNNFINDNSISSKFQIEPEEDIYYPLNSEEKFALAA